MMYKNLRSNIIQAGLVVGTLDILAAFLQFYIKTQKSPVIVLKFIASGVFGTEALNGGNEMIAFGLIFHYIIAFGFTFIFFILYPSIKKYTANHFVIGAFYGLAIWLTMQFVVLPLSQAPEMKIGLQSALTAIFILIICIGIPLSWYAKKTV